MALSDPIASDFVILPNPSGVASKRPFTVNVSNPKGLLKMNDSELECIATCSAAAGCRSKPSTTETLTLVARSVSRMVTGWNAPSSGMRRSRLIRIRELLAKTRSR